MSEYGKFQIQQREMQIEEEEESGFEQFIKCALLGVAIFLFGVVLVFGLNWLEHFKRPPVQSRDWVRPCSGTPEACRNIEKAINEATH